MVDGTSLIPVPGRPTLRVRLPRDLAPLACAWCAASGGLVRCGDGRTTDPAGVRRGFGLLFCLTCKRGMTAWVPSWGLLKWNGGLTWPGGKVAT